MKREFPNGPQKTAVDSDRITTVDLDLDVEVWPGGTPKLRDEEEFQENSAALGYPTKLINDAVKSANEMMPKLENPDRWLTNATEHWYPALEAAAWR